MSLTLLNKPEFYDIFGFIAFIIITLIAFHSFKNKKPLSKLLNYILLLIGILGLIVDGTIIYFNFIR
ncbi:MAG: hypothetical protein AABX83_03190 [Nanoarchaeota archaeon]